MNERSATAQDAGEDVVIEGGKKYSPCGNGGGGAAAGAYSVSLCSSSSCREFQINHDDFCEIQNRHNLIEIVTYCLTLSPFTICKARIKLLNQNVVNLRLCLKISRSRFSAKKSQKLLNVVTKS